MTRQLTALFAAFEALLVVGIGVGIPLLPLTVLWGAQYGFALDWVAFWRASADLWLVGHGVDVRFTLDEVTAASLGFTGAGTPFALTIAALGFALLTVALGVRAGRRVAETGHLLLGGLVAVIVFAGLSLTIAGSAIHPLARPSLTQAAILPALVFALGLGIGMLREARATPPVVLRNIPDPARAFLGATLRGGVGAAALVMLAASVVAGVAILASYARVITLYEGLHTEVLGGVIVTLGQLAFIPNIVVFTASWLIGPGFALGTGSAVGPIGTQLGPIPAIPILGALPVGDVPFGILGLLVPVIAGFLVGAIAGPGVRARLEGVPLLLVGPTIGLIGGLVLGFLAWASAGSAGPGRLVNVGPDPWAVGVFAALEIGLAASLGVFASLRRRAPEPTRTPR